MRWNRNEDADAPIPWPSEPGLGSHLLRHTPWLPVFPGVLLDPRAAAVGRCSAWRWPWELEWLLSSACTLQGWWLLPPSSPLPRPSPLPTHSPLLLCPLHGEGKRRQTEMMKGFSVVHRKPRSRPVNARLSPNMWLWIWAEIQPTPHQLEYFWVCAAW